MRRCLGAVLWRAVADWLVPPAALRWGNLTASSDFRFNLPADLRLPSLYEVTRRR